LTTREIGVDEAFRWGLVDEWGGDPRLLLRRYVPRLACLSTEAVGGLKRYSEELWHLREETRELAVKTISGLLSDRAIQRNIQRFVDEGVFPWET
jgi:polyketide biosynthesis enoyl-CoA hydratase PksH